MSTEKGVFVLMLKDLGFFYIFQHKGCIKTSEVLGLIWTLCQQKLLAMNETPELPARHGKELSCDASMNVVCSATNPESLLLVGSSY